MIITLTGMPGAGKSTVAEMLSKKLGWQWYSIGDLRGKMAREKGLTIDELNTLGETQDSTDKDVDAYQEKLGQEQGNFIVDGRLAWHFIPHSLKVFLDVDEDEASKRIFQASKKGLRKDEKPFDSSEDVKTRVTARLASDKKRYEKYYKIDYLNRNNYDLVINTTYFSPEQIVDKIIASL